MDRKVGFIGAGNIVRAILAGVSKSGKYPKDQIGVFDVCARRARNTGTTTRMSTD